MQLARLLNKTRKISTQTKNTLLQKMAPPMVSAHTLSDVVFLEKFHVNGISPLRQQGNTSAACDALLAHYGHRMRLARPSFASRIRYKHRYVDELSPAELLAEADLLVERRFSLLGLPEVRLNTPINWRHNPTSDPRARWTRDLNRFLWLPVLALAYTQSGDERYAQTFVQWMMHWAHANPPPQYKCERDPIWELMNVGLRCLSWIPAIAMFYDAPAFTPEAKLTLLRSLYDHGRFLYLFTTNRNHLLMETNGLLFLSTHFPELTEARQWQQTALQRLDRELSVQINHDGSQCEVSTPYQWLVTEEYDGTHDLLQAQQLSLPHQDLGCWLEKMYHFLAYIARPDGSWPELNDGFLIRSETLRNKLRQAGIRFKRDDFIYIGTGGYAGTPPTQTSIGFHDAGLYVMRSDWHHDARYLIFDAGPYGGPHGHEDKLSFELFARGQPFIVDSGTYTYNTSDPYRLYFMGSQGHNTILVDGQSQVRRWQPGSLHPQTNASNAATWVSQPRFDYAAATYTEGYSTYHLKPPPKARLITDIRHTRRVLFVKPDYWVILDELQAATPHTYQLLFHTPPDITACRLTDGTVVLNAPAEAAKLYLVCAASHAPSVDLISGQTEPIQGWFSDQRLHKTPATTVRYEWASDARAMIATLMYPCPHDTRDTHIGFDQLTVSGAPGWAFQVRTPHGCDYLLFSTATSHKQFGPYQSGARVAGMRTDGQGRLQTQFEW